MGMNVVEKTESSIVIRLLPPAGPFSKPAPHLMRIVMLEGGAVQITRTAREKFLDTKSDIVTGAKPAKATLTEENGLLHFTGAKISAVIDPETGSLSFYSKDGSLLLKEPERNPYLLSEKPVIKNRFSDDAEVAFTQGVDGIRASVEACEAYTDRTAYECRHSLQFDKTEGLYGLGSHEEGYGNLRGHIRQLYQQNMKAVVPVLVSTKGWGILWDASCLMVFHDDADGSYLWAECADELDFYFMGSGSYKSVMSAYSLLTGAAPLLPKYAYGYMQSKERYKDADELISVVKEYRRRHIPLDVIVLDWCSWPDGQWGYKVFDRSRFPDPQALTDALHGMGAHMMISIWPSMRGDENKNRDEMLASGGMLGNKAVYDAFNEDARRLYWKQANEGLFSCGVDAWWCDCSEPFESDWHGQIKPEVHERVRMNTEEAKKYIDPAKINAYSLLHSKGLYEGQRGTTDKKRVMNLTRSSYAGQHRYATITWSGDVSSTWEVLKRHIPEGLNFCATGEAYWSTDAGGFFPMHGGAWFGQGDFNKGVDDLGFRELYVRWLQYAAFLPIMRSHGTGTPREIWRFGEEGEPFYDAIAKIIRFRYSLLPYLYSLAAECSETGVPLLRVPALIFPDDETLRSTDDEMLLGESMLIKPVTRPMLYGPESAKLEPYNPTESVYLPSGADWYAFDTNERFTGGQRISINAPIDKVPVFVKAGSILPAQEIEQYVGEIANPALTLNVYPGADAEFTLYDDAGDGYKYEHGEKVHIHISWSDKERALTIGASVGSYPEMPKARSISVQLTGGEAQQITYNGKEQTLRF